MASPALASSGATCAVDGWHAQTWSAVLAGEELYELQGLDAKQSFIVYLQDSVQVHCFILLVCRQENRMLRAGVTSDNGTRAICLKTSSAKNRTTVLLRYMHIPLVFWGAAAIRTSVLQWVPQAMPSWIACLDKSVALPRKLCPTWFRSCALAAESNKYAAAQIAVGCDVSLSGCNCRGTDSVLPASEEANL